MSWETPPILLKGRTNGQPAIAYRVFRPSDAKTRVVMSFGYFENMKRYREVIDRWTARGVAAAIYDLRGHGLSEGRRGYIGRFTEYVDDLQALLTELDQDESLRKLGPPVLFGHSLGGLIAIHTALAAGRPFAGLALSSPYLGLAKKVPAHKRIPGLFLSRFAPTISMYAGVRGEDCTRNREIAEAYEDDPMNFKTANVRWFTESVRAQNEAQERAREIKIPLLCVQGAVDKIAQPGASEHFFTGTTSADKEFVSVPGGYHEVLNEPERAANIEKFATSMLRWRSIVKAER